jgi:outer membrane lipoprotein-sorting protein
MKRTWLRWVPAVAVPAVIAAGVLVGSIPARAGDPLPGKSAAEVLTLLGQHSTRSFSGTIEQSSELGLPDLPAVGPTSGPASAGGAASIAELLTGEHTARIFMDGPAKVRVQVVDRLAERNVIRRDSDVWFYNSKDNSAAHLTLPAKASDLPLPAPDAPVPSTHAIPTPEELAKRFLDAADSSTSVTVGPDVQVAGRAAYSLVLAPRTDGTLLEKAVIAIDGETGMPLKVTVSARGQQEPAFEAGFTSLTLAAPEDAMFSFVAPPGATVKELPLPQAPMMPHQQSMPGFQGEPATPGMLPPDQVPGSELHQRDASAPKPTVTGKGWESVIGFPAPPDGQGAQLTESLLKDPLLSQAAVVVPGGRLLSTSLVNVLLTDDGRIFVGMVPAERLQAAAGAA